METLHIIPARIQAASVLRKAILAGEFCQGHKISLTETAARLGISRTPMQTHFRENNLSAASVADDFHISVSSLSREFQRNKHTTFSDYLHCLRLQMAKSQLLQTQKTLRQIAETVGYTNEQTMTRAFKKYEGLTPGEYRTQVENQ